MSSTRFEILSALHLYTTTRETEYNSHQRSRRNVYEICFIYDFSTREWHSNFIQFPKMNISHVERRHERQGSKGSTVQHYGASMSTAIPGPTINIVLNVVGVGYINNGQGGIR